MKIKLTILLSLLVFTYQQIQDNEKFYSSCSQSKNATLCLCSTRNNPSLTLQNKLLVKPLCLKTSANTLKGGGGILGNIGSNLLFTYRGENTATGAPMEIQLTKLTANSIVISWAEDQGYENWSQSNGRIHVTEIILGSSNSAPTIGKDVMIPGCAYNGGIVVNNLREIVTLCPKVCPRCPNKNTLEMFMVHIDPTTFAIKKMYSVMQPACATSDQFCFPMEGGGFRYLNYDPLNDRYAVWYNGRWGGHVADVLTIVDNQGKISTGGWTWACMGGHTGGFIIQYNQNLKDFGVLCDSDIGSLGMIYQKVTPPRTSFKVVPNKNMGQGSMTWPGSMVSCGNHFYITWHGVKTDNSTDNEIDVGFARINALTNAVEKITWVVSNDKIRQKSVKLALLSTGGVCNRFLMGWGSGDAESLYPSKFFVTEVDQNGSMVKPITEVTDHTVWYENTEWKSLDDGRVTWVTTWRRRANDGKPRVHPMDNRGVPFVGFLLATHNDRGYGFQPYWNDPSATETIRFKTNEAFVSVYNSITAFSTSIVPAPPVYPKLKNYYIALKSDPSLVWSVSENLPGKNVLLAKKDPTNVYQIWTYRAAENIIQSYSSGLAVDIKDGFFERGGSLVLNKSDDRLSQRFEYQTVDNMFISKYNGRLAIERNAGTFRTYTWNNQLDIQKFIFVEVPQSLVDTMKVPTIPDITIQSNVNPNWVLSTDGTVVGSKVVLALKNPTDVKQKWKWRPADGFIQHSASGLVVGFEKENMNRGAALVLNTTNSVSVKWEYWGDSKLFHSIYNGRLALNSGTTLGPLNAWTWDTNRASQKYDLVSLGNTLEVDEDDVLEFD